MNPLCNFFDFLIWLLPATQRCYDVLRLCVRYIFSGILFYLCDWEFSRLSVCIINFISINTDYIILLYILDVCADRWTISSICTAVRTRRVFFFNKSRFPTHNAHFIYLFGFKNIDGTTRFLKFLLFIFLTQSGSK